MKKLFVCVIVLGLILTGCASKNHGHIEYTTHEDVYAAANTVYDQRWAQSKAEVQQIVYETTRDVVDEVTAKALLHLHDYTTLTNPILFENDSSDLTGLARLQLKTKADILKRYPDIGIQIVGKASRSGSFKYNAKLSKMRAYKVQQYLIAMGIADIRLSNVPQGYTDSIGPSGIYRRVEFRPVRLKFDKRSPVSIGG